MTQTEQHNHADGEECNAKCDYGNKKDKRQFKLEVTQAPKTLPQVEVIATGNLGDVSGSAVMISIKEVLDIVKLYRDSEHPINEILDTMIDNINEVAEWKNITEEKHLELLKKAHEKGKQDQFVESYKRFSDLYETCVKMKEELDLLKSMMIVELK